MFGRKADREAERAAALDDREYLVAALQEWEGTLKRPYQAAGFDLVAALKHVDALENRASGSSGHPWPGPVKFEMVKRMNGADNLAEASKRVAAAQLEYESALAEHENLRKEEAQRESRRDRRRRERDELRLSDEVKREEGKPDGKGDANG